MGKKLDAFLGRAFKPSKFKSLFSLAISRLAAFKNQRQVRCNQARSDVMHLLQLGHHDRALLRVEQVIKEQNMLDVFVILEGYCNLVNERVHLIEQERVCPDELKVAISGLLFASSRCGDFPKLREIRAVFMSCYGKEFAASSIELHNNCGVNNKVSLDLKWECRLYNSCQRNNQTCGAERMCSSRLLLKMAFHSSDTLVEASDNAGDDDELSDSTKRRKKYRDVADAAQVAFESAAYAAAAARAAVELFRSDSYDPDYQNSLNTRQKTVSEKRSAKGIIDLGTMSFDEVDPIQLWEKDVVIYESDDDKYDGSSFDLNTEGRS
ncbi:proteinous-pairing protein [Hibiscus syriacus]|uniref:Proteinous-pairing protein n=1 Tax=Hibiscus syriacus TaxID=106335 RepID=A0A6A3CRJ8_HIBSY|nr:proteinous-pairing protein [Hibiscus syriacus]